MLAIYNFYKGVVLMFKFGITNTNNSYINISDILALLVIIGIFATFGINAQALSAPISSLDNNIELNVSNLPEYAMFTVIRMLIAAVLSVAFSIIFALLAAKSEKLEKIIVPVMDILQSVPVLGFLTFTITYFVNMFPDNRLGIECAAIFAIFTAQAWNIFFGVYHSFKNIPKDLQEVSEVMSFSPLERFFRLDLPFAIPGLIWNTMLSMSGAWFFIVASEAITVGNISYMLPGVGSYIAIAIKQTNMHAVLYSVITMVIVIFLYDFLLFHPLVAWAEKFKYDQSSVNQSSSYIFKIIRNNFFAKKIFSLSCKLLDKLILLSSNSKKTAKKNFSSQFALRIQNIIWYCCIGIILIYSVISLFNYTLHNLSLEEVLHVIKLTFYTGLRVFTLLILSIIIWLPLGILIGSNVKLTAYSQSVLQFLAAFPANLIFPVVVVILKDFNLNPNIWLTLLMMIGAQWYIAFNIIAGTSVISADLKEVCKNFGIKGKLWWLKIAIPSIFPYLMTGIITAAGGAWNASIVSEIVNWGSDSLVAQGVGSYITIATHQGNSAKVVLGITILSVTVLLINRFLWKPLEKYAEKITQAN